MSAELETAEEKILNEYLERLHAFIDKKFNRKDRQKYVDPIVLKLKMTMWALAGYFKDTEPGYMAVIFKKLLDRGSVVSNLDEVKCAI